MVARNKPAKSNVTHRPKPSDKPPAYEDDENLLVIGIDFGTTYSGIAWATQTDFDSEQINLITSWPGSGREEGKAPTEICYDDEMLWGFEVDKDTTPITWFKLLLLKEEDLSPELRSFEFLLRAKKMAHENGKTAIDLIADYLRAIWRHTLESIAKDRGESVLEAYQFHVVITVPAIWKDYARQDMEKAAKRAGILVRRAAGKTILTFAPEPEAAALSTLCDPGRKPREGDVYLICDAGGGTVVRSQDLITYEITGVDPILMREAVEGTGGLCGGIFIDEAFEARVRDRLGHKWDQISQSGIKEMLKGDWELSIKPQYKLGNEKKEYVVSIPAEAYQNDNELFNDMTWEPFIKNGRIHLRGCHIEKVFAESFAKIDELVEVQILQAEKQGLSLTVGDTIAGIILVGGLGSSPYLYEHLRAQHGPANINILQSTGMRPRTAICRGAVYKGFGTTSSKRDSPAPIQVTSTISRASYGVNHRSAFNPKVHLQQDKIWSKTAYAWEADNQIRWYLKKGENVSTKEPVSHPWYVLYETDSNFDGTFKVAISQCQEDMPPTRRNDSVKTWVTINCSIDTPFWGLKDHWNKAGIRVKRIDYHVEMVPSGASIEFAVVVDGKKVGKSQFQAHFS
ncbi:uncharacterized protein NECHADRAFT_50859 [Fusarium vanettenii 77-13-4]|uniref:Actin-like ATPase domain-containing protein n=1 Tax=Fusarium vanettenii (strain ATCC MYA-4622 / CBS 123669 / FGSC 9596 / NRRL 45880 / 77-13-4) TaxID=660122 RepID=C7Z201_FUSV7|nr:uncharacterized protein NECHADRAFT_50859 [Fusarium vanettenii 77-13-4]EEU41915.1 hypothetical protein NECHADRAFT_50859 [Fusarium vanettenii 77-13-4]